MPDKPLPFVVNDRRKFTSDGDLRPDAEISPAREAPAAISPASPEPTPVSAPEANKDSAASQPSDPDMPPPPTAEQMEQARAAFTATADRLDIAIRSANPGMEHPPAMTFEQLVQSVYMQAILQLGGGTQEGQQPQVDILGARQSIDMLAVLQEKTTNNLEPVEKQLLESALFELRLAFLEITQALARSAAARAGGPAGSMSGSPMGAPGAKPGPSIVR